MKSKMVLIAAALMVLAGSAAFAAIDNSKHDLASTASGFYNEICVYCHTPHGAIIAVPLWNRTNPVTSSFSVYTSSTMNALPGDSLANTNSGMCMSCHDGATGIASAVNNPPNGNTNGGPVSSANFGALWPSSIANLGTDLSNDHPVNVDYISGTNTDMRNPPTLTNVTKLYAGKVQCASCHDPHDTTYEPFLVASNLNSAICASCHAK